MVVKQGEHAIVYTSGRITTAGAIYDSAGKTLAKTSDGERLFNSSRSVRKATLHIVGDPAGVISTGVHNVFKSKLSGYSFINGIYTLKRYGGGTTSLWRSMPTPASRGLTP